ncbi:MAG TPA: DMT family transporter [Thermoanaerobaculia bacterium]|jgi:drug/metabolite transporter (DMT)-like permease|nr:DMT family transporter [Thermoanaerobaculia bacterium]
MPIPLSALLLVIGSSLAWSGFDVCRKVLADRVRPAPLAFLLAAGAVPLFAVWTAIDGMPRIMPGYLPPAAASVALNIGANLLFFSALRNSQLSVTIPLLSLTPVFTTLLAIPMLHEVPAWWQWLGILLVVAGAFVLNLPEGGVLSPAARGAGQMVLVALFWSLTGPFDKMATAKASGPFHATVLCTGVAIGIAVVLAGQHRLRELGDVRSAGWVFVLAVVISIAALGLQLLAMLKVWVGFVETLKRGIGNLSALILGRALFGEAITPRKLLAVGLMIAGVALILASA